MSTPINVIAPDGTPGTVAPEDWSKAEAGGFKLDTPEAQAARERIKTFGGPKGMAKAAGAGVLESVPFLGGALEKQIMGDVSAEKEVNPGSALGGLGLGTVAQSLATGGLGDAALGADGAKGLSIAGRALVKGGLGSIEGGIYGAGNAVNQAVLDDHPLTAEYLIANAGLGAITGGVLAGGLSLGSDVVGKAFEGAGNAERALALRRAVSSDAKTLADAGLTTTKINSLAADGIFKAGDTPVQVQTRVASKLAGVRQEIASVGAKVDASGQTFDLPKIMETAKLKTQGFSAMLQPGDEAATSPRVLGFRQSLAQHGSDDAEKLMDKIDGEMTAKAAHLDPELGQQATKLLERHGDLQALAELSADGVGRGASVAGKGDPLGALLRQGNHIATWGMLSRMAGHLAGGHVGLGGFLGLSAANVIHSIAANPARIGEMMSVGMRGVAKAVGTTQEALESSVTHAIAGGGKFVAPTAAGVDKLLLQHKAGQADVDRVRRELDAIQPIPGGNPHLANIAAAHRALLNQSLPQQTSPVLPAALARQSNPSQKMIQRHNETVMALAQPLAVIGALGKGRATTAQLQAVRMGYPAIAARASSMLLNKAAESGKPLPAHIRRGIEILSGKSLDPALTPQKVARIQAVFAPAQPPGRAGGQPGTQAVRISQKGLSSLDVAGRVNALSQPKGRGE